MKQIAAIFALCLLAAAVVTTGDALGAEQNPAANTGSKRSATAILLKSDPNDAVIREVIGCFASQDHQRSKVIAPNESQYMITY